ncbi:MAG: DUF1987 domain-containing protein [Bacteroidota bacterium]
MDTIRLEKTESTPFVLFNGDAGQFEISGRSIPEDASSFYFPLVDYLDNYMKNPAPHTTFTFYLEYINSISQKMLVDLFIKLSELKHSGKPTEIKWLYDSGDEEIHEEGMLVSNKFGLGMQIRAVSG